MFIIEDYDLVNPNVHTAGDTIDTLNLDFHFEVTQALVAGAAHFSFEKPWE